VLKQQLLKVISHYATPPRVKKPTFENEVGVVAL